VALTVLQPWGVFQTLCITYASEVCPVAMRGYLTTYVNFCWGLGQEIGIGVIMSMLDRDDEWSYRIPYALQWMLVSPFPWLGMGAHSRLPGGLSLSS
jgi:MFS transporter, SP family, general alpha glucoside:H+ symporter